MSASVIGVPRSKAVRMIWSKRAKIAGDKARLSGIVSGKRAQYCS
jgi:hypothetical protein